MVTTIVKAKPYTIMQLKTELDALLLFRDPTVEDGLYEKSYLIVTINETFELKIAVSATLETCKVNQVSFEQSLVFVTYTIGT